MLDLPEWNIVEIEMKSRYCETISLQECFVEAYVGNPGVRVFVVLLRQPRIVANLGSSGYIVSVG